MTATILHFVDSVEGFVYIHAKKLTSDFFVIF